MLKNGVYDLDEIYSIPSIDYDDDKENAVSSFSVNLFPDLVVCLDDVFEYVDLWQ